jgi:hypothetical protein
MNRIAILLLACGTAFIAACEPDEPPRSDEVLAAQADEQVEIQDQTAPQTCIGDETDETPEFDLAVEVKRYSPSRMDIYISVGEIKGLEVCTIRLRVYHNELDEDSLEWKRDGQSAMIVITRIAPGEIATKKTAVREAEFPDVTDPGDPNAWTIEVEQYNDVRKAAS